MTPIDGLSDKRSVPRLGKIRLGLKAEGERSYPRPTDYFVVPEEIQAYTGNKPKTLDIIFPTENVGDFAQQWLKCYSATQGLTCRGDGLLCRRKVDTETGDFASHTTKEWAYEDGLPCEPTTCPKYQEKQCRRVMNLLFMMPDVPGVGCWQIDTTSYYSIININSAIDLIRSLCGRIAFIPLILSLEPKEVEPVGIKKKTVHILQIRSKAKLKEIQRLGTRKPERLLLPELDEEETPGDLFTEEAAPVSAPTPPAEATPSPTPQEPEKKERPDQRPPVAKSRDPKTVTEEDVPDFNALFRLCYECWGIQPPVVIKQLGYISKLDINESPWNCFLKIRAQKEEDELCPA